MKRILIFVAAAVVLVLTVAACGSGAYGSPAGSPSATGTGTVRTMQVGGLGTVLADASGLPLYFNDQETKGTMLCNGSCTTIWRPVTVSGSSPTGSNAAGTLGVVTRSDGTRQLTLDGKPLYTFYADQSGKVTGDGFKDSFNGQDFTWHAVRVGTAGSSTGASASTSQSAGQTGSGQSGNGQSGGVVPGY